ncbi:50S ribosomal protein L29 [Candidatus Beckwithbacteria bacterium RBG_13_35_6]|uniref:Large ribosomal subunit protein uL29 n=1 Tax=Candidatus Beckwithbacteria bacterium RBG_13_35_6 TaxID=1797456 RepID=A0A1F5DG47_9BACT|nr:MAG: 50S ribosomal protein L29 [Candidatus Beckwithbacteria bacterium RBG_13_35_6]
MQNKVEDLNHLTQKELKNLLKKIQAEWLELKMALKTGKLKNIHEPKNKRKEIAKIKTIIREKELEGVKL